MTTMYEMDRADSPEIFQRIVDSGLFKRYVCGNFDKIECSEAQLEQFYEANKDTLPQQEG